MNKSRRYLNHDYFLRVDKMEQSEEVVRNYTKFLKIFEREDFSSTRRGQKNASG